MCREKILEFWVFSLISIWFHLKTNSGRFFRSKFFWAFLMIYLISLDLKYYAKQSATEQTLPKKICIVKIKRFFPPTTLLNHEII
jgi:hypothetical protein